MTKVKCIICLKEINDRERIVINKNKLGCLTIVGNAHLDCWNEEISLMRLRQKKELSD